MKIVSLFSGIGGFDLGFERAGMTCVAQVEIDAKCQKVLEYHWPDVPRFGDIREVHFGRGAADLFCGGFPCQDVSIIGKRAGLAGERSGLWREFHRILEEAKPSWAIVENVPGLLSSNRGRDFATVLRGLAELGYGVCWRVLDAQYFGVPQRRRRVFIIGHLGDGRSAKVLFEPEGGGWDFETRKAEEGKVACFTRTGFGSYREGVGTLIASRGDAGAWSETLVCYMDREPPKQIRRMTPKECERLQGFPDDWTLIGSISETARHSMLGNAVCVPVAEWVGRRILATEEG